MKKTAIAALALLVSGLLVAESAFARGRHHHRGHAGFYFGVPLAVGIGLGFRSYYPPPYYYSPYHSYPSYYPAPVVQQQPIYYVEQNQPPAMQPSPPAVQPFPPAVQPSVPGAQPSAPASWYFCAASRAYYPYVKECPAGWQRVAPQPG